MQTLRKAHDVLSQRVQALSPCTLPVVDALDCRLAGPVRAETDWPAADVSMMDGYAARAGDLVDGRPLAVAFEVPAGTVPPELPAGRAARIFTGAVLPSGADVIVPQELARPQPDHTVILPPAEPGTFVRPRGGVCRERQVLLNRDERITPARLAMLVAAGPARVSVIPRPRIGLVPTGSELLAPGEALRPGQIRDSNGPMLAALACAAGLPAAELVRVGDDLAALRDTLEKLGSRVDLLVTSGGVSVGDYDLVPRALEALGAELVLHRVAVKPGKPILVARLHACWVVGLPGNPVSALVGWHLFAWPIARRLAGEPGPLAPRMLSAELTGPLANRGERTLFAPVRLQAGDPPRAEPVGWQGSHDVVALAHADALVEIEPGAEHAAGQAVRCLRLDAPPRDTWSTTDE